MNSLFVFTNKEVAETLKIMDAKFVISVFHQNQQNVSIVSGFNTRSVVKLTVTTFLHQKLSALFHFSTSFNSLICIKLQISLYSSLNELSIIFSLIPAIIPHDNHFK